MNTQKQVMSKIAQIQKENKVELKMADYKNLLDQALKEKQKIDKVLGEIQSLQKEKSRLSGIIGSASVAMDEILKKGSQQLKIDVKAATDLGLDVKELKGEYNFLKNNIDTWQKLAEKASQITKQ